IDKLDHYFEKITAGGGGREAASINAKEVFAGFTIDVIASTAFATETNANDDRSKKNPFVVNGLNIFKFPVFKVIAFFLFPPFVNKLLGIKTVFRDREGNFFLDLCREIVSQRKQS